MPLHTPFFRRRSFRYRSTRVTSEGLQFLIFTLAIGIAAINTGNNLFYLPLAMMLSLILISGIVAEYCLRRLEFHRHLPDFIVANQPATATLVVKNRKSSLPSFSLAVFDVSDGRDLDRGATVHHLPADASRLVSYPFLARRRGKLHFEGVRVATEFPFGLFMKKAFYAVGGTVVVGPEITPLNENILQGLVSAGQEQSLHRRGQGTDLYNLRVYHAGDDSRSIHWPTTARTSQLMIRETEAEEQRRATIRLSTIAPLSHDAVFEQAVSLSASLVQHLVHQGYLIRLIVGASRSIFGHGEPHLYDLLRMLALCERRASNGKIDGNEGLESDHAEADGGTEIVVQSWSGPSELQPNRLTVLINGQPISGGFYGV
ncbi:MAG: hypothetical protein CV090_04695 [Nitrospira sp. WS238]|nr:hypothetical protein [Nitrospira sp. WS238]